MYENEEEYINNRIKDNTFLYGVLNGTHVEEMGATSYIEDGNLNPSEALSIEDFKIMFKDNTVFRHVSSGTNKNIGRLSYRGSDYLFTFSKNSIKKVM